MAIYRRRRRFSAFGLKSDAYYLFLLAQLNLSLHFYLFFFHLLTVISEQSIIYAVLKGSNGRTN